MVLKLVPFQKQIRNNSKVLECGAAGWRTAGPINVRNEVLYIQGQYYLTYNKKKEG
jgi:hypothetical protein